MDWASNEWKQSLSSIALQKVNTLEETVTRLQKERQQKQLQCECLELALDKEKRKVDEGKQQYVQLERQLQSLADTNKSFENKTLKLQNEIQSRDLRINSLESLLSQAKKENSRLQQLEKDIEELQCLKESAQQEVEKLKQGQNVRKKDCVISELELQIKALQKSQNRENSLLDISDVKENIRNAINTSCTQDYKSCELDTLKEKVSEQESIIKELRKKLNIQDEVLLESVPNTFSNTPAKVRGSFVDSPPKSIKKSLNSWNNFGSTPMKEYRGFRHQSDSSTFSSTEEEKIQFLQLRVKQLCQELECQRHNSEASKNSLEQKMKEKENVLKAEIKNQAQIIADLDKEVKEVRNKYQQEISQASKKLDLMTLQLSKAEQVKVQLEADKRSLGMKISACEVSLKQKEEELEEIHKAKLSCEAKMQTLISENSDFEKSCKVLQDKNSSLTEELKTVQIQLEGSNNLVKEKENAYYNIKKEIEILSKSHGLLENKVQQLEDAVAAAVAENKILEAKIEEYSLNEATLKEKTKFLEEEKKEFLNKASAEAGKILNLESKIKELNAALNKSEEDLSLKAEELDHLSQEMANLKEMYQAQNQQLEVAINEIKIENSNLEAKICEYSANEGILKEKGEILEKEKEEFLMKIATESDNVQVLESKIKELTLTLKKAEGDLSSKVADFKKLSEEILTSKDSYESKVQELEDAVAAAVAENKTLEAKIEEYSLSEATLKQKTELLEKEKKEVLNKATAETGKILNLESNIKDLNAALNKSQEDLSLKAEELEHLSQNMANLKEMYESKVQELEDAVAAAVAENKTLEAKFEEYSLSEATLKQKTELLEKEKKEVLNKAAAETGKILNLESNIKELNVALNKSQEDLFLKAEELEHISQEMANLKEMYENKVLELKDAVTAAVAENKTLEAKIEEYSLSEAMLKEKTELLEKEKKEVLNKAAAETGKILTLESNIDKLNATLNKSQEDLSLKAEELEHLSQELANVKEMYEAKIQQMEIAINEIKTENANLEVKICEYSVNEGILKEKVEILEKEKEGFLMKITTESDSVQVLESKIKELTLTLKKAEGDLSSKVADFEKLSEEMLSSKDSYENKIRELEDAVAAAVSENKTLEAKIEEYCLNEAMLKEKTELLEKEKKEVLNKATAETGKILNLKSNIKELNAALNKSQEDLSLKAEELEHVSQEMAKLKEMYENKVLELKDAVAAAVAENKTLEAKIEEYSLSEDMLKEKTELLEKEKKEVLNKAAAEAGKILNLESNVKELNVALNKSQEDLSLKAEELEHLSQELANVKKMYEAKIQQLEDAFNEIKIENANLEAKISEYSVNEGILKEKGEILEKEKEEFLMKIATESDNVQVLESKIKELTLTLKKAEGDLSSKVADFEKLSEEMLSSKDSYENKIRELEDAVAAAVSENKTLEAKIEEYSLSEAMLKEKTELLEKEKKEVLNKAVAETGKILTLESNIEELNAALNKSQEDLSLKAEELEHLSQEMTYLKGMYENKIRDVEDAVAAAVAKNKTLEAKIEEYSLSETMLKEENELLKEEKKKILFKAVAEARKIHASKTEEYKTLESNTNRLNAAFIKTRENLSLKDEELEHLRQEMANLKELYEAKIQQLEDAFNEIKIENANLEAKISEYSVNEGILKEKGEILEKEKEEFLMKIATESDNVQVLESKIKELTLTLKKAEGDLSSKVADFEKLSEEMLSLKDSYENKIRELEDAVAAAVSENKTLEGKIEEYSLSEATLETGLLEKEEKEVLNKAAAETDKILTLESNIKELNAALNNSQEDLSLKAEELEHLSQEMTKEMYEYKMKKLENAVTAAESENVNLKVQIEEYSLSNDILEKRLKLLEKEKEELSNKLAADYDKIIILDSIVKELRVSLNKVQDEQFLKIRDLDHINEEIKALKDNCKENIHELEKNAEAAKTEVMLLENQIKDLELKNNLLEEKYLNEEMEKEKVWGLLAVEKDKAGLHDSKFKELEKIVGNLSSELSLKIEECNAQRQELVDIKVSYNNEIEQLQSDITAAKSKISFLETRIKMVETNKRALEEELELLQIEEERLLNSVTSETEKTATQSKRLEELTFSVEELQIQLSLKTEEYDELKRELINAKSFTESVIIELEEAKSAVSLLENQVKELELSNKSLNKKFLNEKKEKDRINEELIFQIENKDLLDSLLKEQQNSVQILQTEFLQKEEECKQLSSDLANLQVLHEEKIHEYEDRLSSTKSEKVLLENQLTGCLTKQNLLIEKLESFAIAKNIVHGLLSAETSRVQMLGIGLGEIKTDLINLQSLLNQSDAQSVNYSSKRGDQKDSLKASFCKTCLSKNRKPEIISDLQQNVNFTESGIRDFRLIRNTAVMFQNLKETCFLELNESAFNTFTYLCSLEKNLADKLSKCEFLVCRKLLDDKSLFDVCFGAFNLRKHLHVITNLRNISFCIIQKTSRDSLRIDICLNEILNLFSSILCKSKPFDNEMQIERSVTEPSVKLQKNLKSIMLFISKNTHKILKTIELYPQFLDKFQNIHCNNSHFPVIKNTHYILRINKINNTYRRHEILNSEHSPPMQDINIMNFIQNLNFKEIISIVGASYCSVLLNFAVCVFDEGISKISSNDSSNILSNFGYSLLSHQELNDLCLLIPCYSNGDPIQSYINNIINSVKLDIINMYPNLCYKNMKFNDCNFGAIMYDKNKYDTSKMFFKDVKKMIYEIEKLKHEIAAAQKRIDTLQHCNEIEKMKNIKLNTVIEEVENELSQVCLEREKLKRKFLDAKKLFIHVQDLISFKSGISAMEIDIDSFSESCFCEICETASGGTCSLDEYHHEFLKPINLLKSVVEFIATHNNLKTEIQQIQIDMSDFQAENTDLHSKIAELKTDLDGMAELKTEIEQMRTSVSDFEAENTILKSTVAELKKDLEAVTDSLKLKEKEIVILNSEYDRLTKISEGMPSFSCKEDCSISELKEIGTELGNSVINKSEKLNEYGKALEEIHAENSKINLHPNSKDEEILIFQNSIHEKEKALQQMSLKCEKYEKEINDLNVKLYRFEVDKEILQTSEQQSKKFISELQKKVKSLEQSKISLNLTIENVEEELQNMYSEKQELQNKLDELTAQTNNSLKRKDLEQDILFWKDKYEEEKKFVGILSRNVQELEKMKEDHETYCEELKNRNKILETDVMILKNIKFEHECALLEKISNSEHNFIIITQLKQKISDIETEKLELESKIKELEVNLYCEQETEVALRNEIQNVKDDLENIKVEKLREAANYKNEICKLEKEREKIKIYIEELSEECSALKLKLKDMIEDKKKDNKIIEELKKEIHTKSMSVQNELQEALEKQHKKENIALKKLNQELEEAHAAVKQIKAINCELHTEISLLKANQTLQIESYKKQYDDLSTKFIRLQVENQDMKLKISSNANTFNNNSSSELQNAKTALATAKIFIVKILNLIISVIESYSLHEEYETGKSDLISLKTAWEQSIEILLKSEHKLQNDIPTWLVSFFKTLNFNKEIQVMIQNISKSICNFVSEAEEHPEIFINKQMSFGDYINDINWNSNFAILSSSIITELLCNLRLLQQTFYKLKEIIWKNKKEMNQQKELIEEMSLKLKAAVSNEQKNQHGNPPDTKLNLIRLNYRRLEKKHENLLKTCEEMEQRIKGLEEEKQNLEDEMEEMVSKLKGSDSTTDDCPNELFNTLVELGEVKKQNSNLERENKWLKSVLQKMQSSSKNHEIKEDSYSTCTVNLPSSNSEASKF